MAIKASAKMTIDPLSVKYASEMSQWTVLWGLMWFVCKFALFRKYGADFSNRVVSIVHAVVAMYYSYLTFENGWSGMYDNIGGPNTEAQTLCMALSLSYFTYDLIYCAVCGDFMNVVHHMFTMGGLASGVLNGKSGAELVACLFLMEVSNPSLHLRTVLIDMGLKTSSLASVNSLVFALMFLVCRLVIGPPLVWKTLASPDNDYIVKAGGFGILAVSVFWGMSIIRIIVKEVKKLMGGGKAKQA